uniref:Uncharacterized protein n=1 Tax=Candidatus Kentrum sp. FW TaxID=2126338 RepID=A0A450TVB8_9GAMM|nr:MAG: hypothetical protein BECKFW1821A_GA0114235_105411 [Candidatus Kentron sp. FW]VFJ72943.1 MAG: hypothetical protein BECKFW1821C_GA0114237_10417 [Candidatus Kentron sp. FW]
MKVRVGEQGVILAKEYFRGVDIVDIRREHDVVIVSPIVTDPIRQLGAEPVVIDISDASQNHDKYIYPQ